MILIGCNLKLINFQNNFLFFVLLEGGEVKKGDGIFWVPVS